MAWSALLPADTEKIRDLGSVIRDNWDAIEQNDTAVAATSLNQWVVHLIDRATIGGANTPARIDDIGMVYCRNDGSFNELYFEDSQNAANEIQLTEDGKIGSETTQIVTQDISFGSETATYSSDNMTAYWAAVNSSGTILSQSGGLTCVRNSTGKFTVTFSVAQSDGNYGVHLSVENDPGNSHTANYHTKTVNDFKLTIVNQNATKLDNAFTVSVYGKRP